VRRIRRRLCHRSDQTKVYKENNQIESLQNPVPKTRLGSVLDVLTVIRIRLGKENVNKAVALLMLILGLSSLLGSVFYSSYVAAFVGVSLSFWGALLLFLMPTKHVRLELLTATAASSLANTERLLASYRSKARGVYLPPKLLRDYQSSLVYVPANEGEPLPKREEIPEQNPQPQPSRAFYLTPPGLGLSRLFEKHLGRLFTETSPDELQRLLPRLFEELEITKNTLILLGPDSMKVELRNHIFKDLTEETDKLKLTIRTAGSPLSSAIACALAKATGKPVTILNEETTPDETTTIQYSIHEE